MTFGLRRTRTRRDGQTTATDDEVAEPMRIGLVAPPWVPTPPPAYGGTERVVGLLAAGLVARGHDVVLVAAPGSDVPGARVVTPLDVLPAQIGGREELRHAEGAVDALRDCHAVIDHSSLTSTRLLLAAGIPTAHVTHGAFDRRATRAAADAARTVAGLRLVAISESQARTAPGLPFMSVCHNAVDLRDAPFRPDNDGYLVFVGRMCHDKGVREAITIARALGAPLRIAAKCREPEEHAYFAEHVEPLLGDGIEYLGELDEAARWHLIAGARALVFPIAWEEPFGMVLIEAMAVGTPVLAIGRGAVPEVVRDGVTGIVRRTVSELIRFAPLLDGIDPHDCRAHVAARFSPGMLTRRYETVARSLASGTVPAARRDRRVLARVGAMGLMA